MLFEVTKFVAICYSSNRKLEQKDNEHAYCFGFILCIRVHDAPNYVSYGCVMS